MTRDIADWLRENNLGHLTRTFTQSDISVDLLADLDTGDLREPGLTLGDRKRFQRAMSASTATTLPPAPVAQTPGAERRQLTVMFVDLIGSTALTETLDPEDMSDVVSAFQATVQSCISRHGGYISRYMGDGVLVYFGWPTASEDDAVRATRAALCINTDVSHLRTPSGEPLACRCGIATGLVVVGELIGTGTAQEHVVVGETPNLAARLQGLAEPDCTVISDSTRRLIGNLFELQPLGLQRLKGIKEETPAYSVLKAQAVESRFHAEHQDSALPMIGREQQLSLLTQGWQQACDGLYSQVLLQGEAGIGKSRLLHGFLESLTLDPRRRVIFQCDAQHGDTALYPARQFFMRVSGISNADDQSTRQQKLRATVRHQPIVSHAENTASTFALIAALIGVDTDDDDLSHLTAEQTRALTLQAICKLVQHLPTENTDQSPVKSVTPLLFVLEDSHWVDPTTLELLKVMAADATPVFTLITARPEFHSQALPFASLTVIAISRLSEHDCKRIVAAVTGNTQLPDAIVNEIVQKTDGIPLFAEELTKTVIESNTVQLTQQGYIENPAADDFFIPSSLHDSLMARLDRLQPVREVAQTAACLGREFALDLLLTIVPINLQQLTASLQTLIDSDLIFKRDDNTYSFKHALVRDAAYESLLKSKRQHIHLTIAKMLEAHFDTLITTQPELAAYHLQLAASYPQATVYWHRATTLALQRVANREAISHASHGLECLQRTGDNTEPDRHYELLFARGMGHMAVHGYAAESVSANFNAAMQIAQQLDDTERYSQAARGVVTAHIVSSRFSEGLALADSMLATAQTPMQRFYALRMLGQIYLWQARFEDSRHCFEQAIALYDPDDKSPLSQWDDGVLCIGFLGITLTCIGETDRGEKMHRQSVQMATTLNQPFSHCQAMESWITSILLRGDDFSAPLATLIKLADTHQMVFFKACAQLYQGIGLMRSGKTSAGNQTTVQGLELYRACQSRLGVPKWITYVAEGYQQVDQHSKSIELLDEAATAMDQMGNEYFRAEWWRVRAVAEVHLEKSKAIPEQSFKRSIQLCQSQGAKLFELTSTMALARFLMQQGKPEKAGHCLRAIVNSFTGQQDFAHLTTARRMLSNLER